MALLVSDMVTAVRVTEIYQSRHGNQAPADYQTLAREMGLFVKEPTQQQKEFRDDIICGLYMVPGAGVKGKQAMAAFVRDHSSGFKQNTNVLLREQTTFDGNYAKVATQLGRYKVPRGCQRVCPYHDLILYL